MQYLGKTLRIIYLLERLVGGAVDGKFGNAIFFGISFPTTAKPNDVFINTDTGALYSFNGSIWNLEYQITNDKNYVHVQSIAASTWIINHGLDKKPSITIFDDSNNIIEACVTHVDNNNVTINFFAASSPVNKTGSAVFN